MPLLKLGRVKIPGRKNEKSLKEIRMPLPFSVVIPLSQHIGEPARPVVKVGDKVYVGTLIGEACGVISANIHSSVSGTVKKIDSFLMPNGKNCESFIIESDGKLEPDPSISPPTVTTYAELQRAARDAGLVGLGGAGFPTHLKLAPEKLSKIDTLIINGAECEPYITSDTRTMLDDADFVYRGVKSILDLSGIPRAIIGIEENKPECISKMREIFAHLLLFIGLNKTTFCMPHTVPRHLLRRYPVDGFFDIQKHPPAYHPKNSSVKVSVCSFSCASNGSRALSRVSSYCFITTPCA